MKGYHHFLFDAFLSGADCPYVDFLDINVLLCIIHLPWHHLCSIQVMNFTMVMRICVLDLIGWLS